MRIITPIAFVLALLAQQGAAQAQTATPAAASPTHVDFNTDKERTLTALKEVHLEVQEKLGKWGGKMAGSSATEQEGLRTASETAKQQITTLDLAIRKVSAANEQDWAEVRRDALTTAQNAKEALDKASVGLKAK